MNNTSVDRLPPHDTDAERAVLGCVMLGWKEAVPIAIQRIGKRLEIFYDLRHQEVYRVMVEMYDSQEAIDLITLSNWLRFQSLLEQVGGTEYLVTFADSAPSASNIEFYLDIIEEKLKYRQLIRMCTHATSAAFDPERTAKDLIERAASDILDLAEQTDDKSEESPVSELIYPAISEIERWHQTAGQLTGIGTGFADYDKMTGGLHAGEMTVLAGRPSLGKSSWSMNVVDHVSVDLGLPVGVFSLEMTKESLVIRMICSRARLNLRHIQTGHLNDSDLPKLTTAAGRLHSSRIFINDKSGLSILSVRTRARRMAQQHGIKLLVIDYLQLMHADRNKNDSREQEVSHISAGIKQIAKELGIPVIAVSQLNRTIEKDKPRRPRLSDLRESGALEQDADVVGILWRPSGEADSDEDPDAIGVNLEICKQRNGPTGTVELTFLRKFTRYESCARALPHYQGPCSDHEPNEPSIVPAQQEELQV